MSNKTHKRCTYEERYQHFSDRTNFLFLPFWHHHHPRRRCRGASLSWPSGPPQACRHTRKDKTAISDRHFTIHANIAAAVLVAVRTGIVVEASHHLENKESKWFHYSPCDLNTRKKSYKNNWKTATKQIKNKSIKKIFSQCLSARGNSIGCFKMKPPSSLFLISAINNVLSINWNFYYQLKLVTCYC